MTRGRRELSNAVDDIVQDAESGDDPLGEVYVTFGPDPDDPEDIPENGRTIDFNNVDT